MNKEIKKSKEKLLDVLAMTRTFQALDEASVKNKDYQKTLKRQDKAFDALEKAGLSRKQKGLVDMAVSSVNDCGATYGAIAYELGLQDGIRLMSEIMEIKQL